jgi:hypothetical protein
METCAHMGWIRGLALFVAGIVVGTIVMQSSAAQGRGNTGPRLNHLGVKVRAGVCMKVMGFRVAYAFASPDGRPTTIFLQSNRDTFLEVAPASTDQPPGITHTGIWSDDASATVTQLRQAGAKLDDARPSTNSGPPLARLPIPTELDWS